MPTESFKPYSALEVLKIIFPIEGITQNMISFHLQILIITNHRFVIIALPYSRAALILQDIDGGRNSFTPVSTPPPANSD